MKKCVLIITFLLLIQLQADAVPSLNCFEPSVNGNRASESTYYNEKFVEPYRYGNYFNKSFKEWYNETMYYQRQRNKDTYKTYFNWNDLNNHNFWK